MFLLMFLLHFWLKMRRNIRGTEMTLPEQK